MLKLMFPAVALAALALTQEGCPKDDKPNDATPVASATATAASGMSTASPASSPAEMGMATPMASPAMTSSATANAAQTKIHYRWSGGLSPYQYYEMTIQGAETADVVFKIKPIKSEEKTVTDTLDAATFAELKGLFDSTQFETLTEQPRKVRIMDIGERAITIERGGRTKKVIENGATTASGDLQALRKWLDVRVRKYMDQSGVGPKRSPDPMASPAASPVPMASPAKK